MSGAVRLCIQFRILKINMVACEFAGAIPCKAVCKNLVERGIGPVEGRARIAEFRLDWGISQAKVYERPSSWICHQFAF